MNQPAQKRAILAAAQWVPDFIGRSPMFAPFALYADMLSSLSVWPDRKMLQTLLDRGAVCNRLGSPIRLVAPGRRDEPYEQRIYERGELQVREGDWHDLFNVLVWLTYPRAKAALNERHFISAARERSERMRRHGGTEANRGRTRDALTLFDESGAVVVSSDPHLLQDLRHFRWKHLFWDERSRTRIAMRFCLFGHALFEKALEPYVGMTAHATTFVASADFMAESPDRQRAHIDAVLAERIRAAHEFVAPQTLAPVPLLGVPDWWDANESEAFYDNETYFRRGRKGRSA